MSKSKARGTAAETSVVRYLQANGFRYAERRALAGSLDCGDVTGIPDVVIEVKDHSGTQHIGEWMAECRAETLNAEASIGAVWSKARGTTDPARWRVSLDGETFVRLLRAWCDQTPTLFDESVDTVAVADGRL